MSGDHDCSYFRRGGEEEDGNFADLYLEDDTANSRINPTIKKKTKQKQQQKQQGFFQPGFLSRIDEGVGVDDSTIISTVVTSNEITNRTNNNSHQRELQDPGIINKQDLKILQNKLEFSRRDNGEDHPDTITALGVSQMKERKLINYFLLLFFLANIHDVLQY